MNEPYFNALSLTDIVWIQTSFIGDIILTTAGLALVKKHWPHLKQHVITNKVGTEVLKNHPCVDSLIEFHKKKFLLSSARQTRSELMNKLHDRERSLVIQAHRSTRSSLLAWFIGLPTITYAESGAAFLASVRVKRDRALHEKDRVSQLLEPLGISRTTILASQLFLSSAKETKNSELQAFVVRHKNIAAIAPGSQWGTKMWPVEKYAEIANRFLKIGYAVLILGSTSEASIKNHLLKELQRKNLGADARILAPETSFEDLFFIFPNLKILVSNDSSPVHFASSFNTPTVAIFGPTIPEFGFYPLAQKSASVGIQNLNCRPCSSHGPMTCPLGHFRCMQDLHSDTVWESISNILQINPA